MDSSTYKHYDIHGFESRQFLEHYLSHTSDRAYEEDALKFPMKNIENVFTEVKISGDTAIDLSIAPMVHHLYTACEFFKEIIVLKISERCIMELNRWVDTRTGAFNWDHAINYHLETTGRSDQIHDKEGKMRSAIPHILKCDIGKKNMTDPIVLPPADCVISAWFLGTISKDKEDYIKYLRKLLGLLKPGGYIILIGALDGEYYTVGKDKIHYLKYDEEFARSALVGEGYTIDYCNVKKRTDESRLIVYEAVICIAAHKEE